MKIRDAEEKDLHAIARIHIESRANAYRGILPDEMLDGNSATDAVPGWRKTLTSFPGNLTVAEVDSDVLAFCCAGAVVDAERNAPFDYEIYGLHVLPGHRRKGLGALLLQTALRRSAKQGYSAAIVWTFSEMHLSRKFYEREGACVVKEGFWRGIPEVAYGWSDVARFLL